MRVCIDAGHGGNDSGAVNKRSKLKESDIALKVSTELAKILEENGYATVLTRKYDEEVLLAPRVKTANKFKSDIFISIHCNGFYKQSVEGIETYKSPGSRNGNKLANAVHNEITSAFPRSKNRKVKSAGFYVLNFTRMPAILVELEFITNNKQAELLSKPEVQKHYAMAIFKGIEKYNK